MKAPKHWKKWIAWSIGALALLFVLGTLWVRFYLDPYLKNWLCMQVEKGTAGAYKLEIQDLKYRFWQMSLEVRDVKLYSFASHESEGLKLSLKVKELNIKHIDWWTYWQTQKIKIHALELNAPTIDFYNPKVKKTPQPKDLPAQIRAFVGKITTNLTIERIVFTRAKCLINAQTATGKVYHQCSSLDLLLEALEFDIKRDPTLGNFKLQVLNYQGYSPDGFYSVHCQILQANMRDSSVTLRHIRCAPRQENLTRDKVTLQLPYLRTKGVDFFQAWYRQIFKARTLEARYANLRIQSHVGAKLLPKDLRLQLHEFPVPIAIDSLLMSKIALNIQQTIPQTAQTGHHKIEEASLSLYKMRIGQAHNPNAESEAGFDIESGLPFFAKSASLTIKNYTHESASRFYKFGVKLIHLSSRDSLLHLEKAYLQPRLPAPEIAQSLAYQSIISTVNVPSLTALKVDFEKMLYQQIFRLGTLRLHAPVYEGYLDTTKPKLTGQKFRNFEEMLRSIPLDIQAELLDIQDAKVTYKSLQKKQDNLPQIATHALEKLHLQIQKIDLGRALNESAIEHIDTKKLTLKAQNYSYQNPENTYELKATSVEALAEKHLIIVQNLSLMPTAQNTQAGKLTLEVPQMRGEGIDFVGFMLKQQMDWQKLTVKSAKIEVATTTALPALTKAKNTPQKTLIQILQTLPVFVKVDTLAIKDVTFTLEEKNATGITKSRHHIENMEAQLLGIALGEATRYEADSTAYFWEERSLAFALQKYTYQAQNLTYQFTLENIQKQAQNHTWRIDALAWHSVLDMAECRKQFPQMQWLAEGKLQSITLEIDDLKKIVFEKKIAIQSAIIQDPDLKFWFFQTLTNQKLEAGGFENLPIHLSVDTLYLQNAHIQGHHLEQNWTQTTELNLSLSHLQWDKKITWHTISLAGKEYILQHPQGQARAKNWLLTFDKQQPRFYAKKVLCKSKENATLELDEVSAELEAIQAGKRFKIKQLQLRNGKAEIYTPAQKSDKPTDFKSLPTQYIESVYLENIAFKVHQQRPEKIQTHTFLLEEARLASASEPTDFVRISHYETALRHYLYKARAEKIHWQSKTQELTIQELSILPTVSEKFLNRQQTHQKELYEAHVTRLKARNFDLMALLEKNELHIQKLSLDSLEVHLSADRRLPTRFKRKRMPAEMLKAMKMTMKIDTILLNGLNLSYQEKVLGASKEGKLFVNGIKARLTGLNNRPAPKDSLYLHVAGKLMDLGEANLKLHMALQPDMQARLEGTMGKFKANFMNDFLESTQHLQIRKGEVQGARFWLSMQDSTALGVLEAGYKHLRLDILSAKKENKRRGFITFIANIFIKNRNNLNRQHHKVGDILYMRPPEDTFVRFLIRALVMGVLNTLK